MQTREELLNGLAEIATLLTAAAAITQRVYTGLANGDHGVLCQSREHPGSFGGTIVNRLGVDTTTCSIEWKGHRYVMGPSLLFRIIHRLALHPDRYFTYDVLMSEVWERKCDDTTVRTAVKRLRRVLCDAGMSELAAAIRGRDRRYGLFLDRSAP